MEVLYSTEINILIELDEGVTPEQFGASLQKWLNETTEGDEFMLYGDGYKALVSKDTLEIVEVMP